ncbi:MAG: Flp family type IVb pilin [Dehalococcoidia bacterium]|nr:Flp family type IVb pilin [Dehalococcoidia bacterium]
MRDLMLKAVAWKQTRQPREEGQTVIEYALIVAAVSIVLIVGLWTFGDAVIGEAQERVNGVWDSFGGGGTEPPAG